MPPFNKRNTDFNANVAQVWVEEPGFTGYKSLDFTKLDQIEDLLRSGINVSVTGLDAVNVSVTGGNLNVLNEVEIKNTENNPIPVSNDILTNILVNKPNLPTGIAVYQTALNKDLDNVSVYVSGSLPAVAIAADQKVGVTGDLPAVSIAAGQSVGVTGSVAVTNASINTLNNNLSSVIFSEENSPSGVVVYQSNLNKDLDNVSVYVSGSLPAVNLAAGHSPIPISNSNLDLLSRVLVTGETIPSGLAVYQTALNKELDNVSVYVSGSLPAVNLVTGQKIIAKSDIGDLIIGSGPVRTVSDFITLGVPPANFERKELFIQNLATEKLYVSYGNAYASNANFSMILAANSAQDAGDGGSVSDTNYKGLVSVSGDSPRYVAWERFGPI